MARLLKRCLEVCASHLWKILEKQKLIIIIKQKFQETHQFLLRKTGSERSENLSGFNQTFGWLMLITENKRFVFEQKRDVPPLNTSMQTHL